METNLQESRVMEIRYLLPGKSRPRVIQAHWQKGIIEAFRELWKKFPDAIPLTFDGHQIKKSA